MKLISKISAIAAITLCSLSATYAQQPGPNKSAVAGVAGVAVKYNWYSDSQAIGDPITLLADHDYALIKVDENEKIFVDFDNKTVNRLATLSSGKVISTKENLPTDQTITLIEEKVESDYNWGCKRYELKTANAVYEYVTTNNLGYFATPMPELAIPETLVLEIYKDGELICKATELNRIIYPLEIAPASMGKEVSKIEYRTSVINDSIKRN